MQKIPFVEMADGTVVKEAPPDGKYAVISHLGLYKKTAVGVIVKNPFPWSARIYEFSGGEGVDRAYGSNVEHMLTEHPVKKIILVGLSDHLREELKRDLIRKEIELVPEAA